MVDLGFSGNPFTWSNYRHGWHPIKQGLDRCVASTPWINLFPSFSIRHLPAHTSDHNPLILNTITPNPQLPNPFRFEEFWTKVPFCNVISAAWKPHLEGSYPYIPARKLKSTKATFKAWNNLQFGNIQQQIISLSC